MKVFVCHSLPIDTKSVDFLIQKILVTFVHKRF